LRRAIDGLLWGLWTLSLASVVVLSLSKEPPIIPAAPWDRVGHILAYFTFTGLLLLAAVWRPGRGAGRWPGRARSVVLVAVTLGASLEGIQGLVGRDPDMLDLTANLGGAGLGWLAWRAVRAAGARGSTRETESEPVRSDPSKEGTTVLGWSATLALAWGVLAAVLQPVPRGTTAPGSVEASVWPTEADSYVTAASPTRNFGSRRRLIVDPSPRTRSLLRFDVDETCDLVTDATLRVFARKGRRARFAVRRIGNEWDEGTITHRSVPVSEGTVRRSSPVRRGRWTSADVTPLVGQRQEVSFALSSKNRRLVFGSREGPRDPALTLKTVPGLEPVPAQATPPPPVRGVYGSCSDGYRTVLAAGFNAVTVGAYREELDVLAASGLQGVVWLGAWDDASCTFEYDDDWVISHVEAIREHPAILAYQITDEPKASDCPSAPAAMAARSALVKSIDPTKPTYLVVQASDGESQHPYEKFVGTTDIMGVDIYPCSFENGCRMEKIDQAIAALEQDDVPRYWALIQAFEDGYYRMPSPAELHAQFARWRSSDMEGYFVFSLNYENDQLESHRDVLAALREENAV
jgi:VanZ family protein